jgi:threonine dehydratase
VVDEGEKMASLSVQMIDEAAERMTGFIRKTPLEYSSWLSDSLRCPVYLKLECMQLTGSFKLRGAFCRLGSLSKEEREKGVLTCSAGNHGKAVAYVANKMGIKATIYVPKNVDQAKYQGILKYGAEVIVSPFTGYDETEALACQVAKETHRLFISPFDETEIMAGNGGTLAREVLEELPDARTFILPVGGGGMAAGFALYVKEKLSHAQVIGCQHQDSPGLKLSLEQGQAVTQLPAIQTVAGGVEGGLGAHCFKYLKARIDDVILVSEREIENGFCWMLDKHQYLIEPSAAVVIAACLSGKIQKLLSPTVIVLSGRNVSFSTMQNLLNKTGKPL